MSLYPRKLPDLPTPPRRYSSESDAAYRERHWRWRIWLDHDRSREELGGPPMSYASENEIQAWRQWVDQKI